MAGEEGTPALEARDPSGSEGGFEEGTPQVRALELVEGFLKMVQGAEKSKSYFTSNKVRLLKDLGLELKEAIVEVNRGEPCALRERPSIMKELEAIKVMVA